MSKFVLALDQGTTSSRALLFDCDGNIIDTAQAEFTQLFPRAGWVEHDPNEIWSTQRQVAERLLHDTKTSPSDIATIGITNQRETTVLWDRRTGEPLYNAIVWQCRRTTALCEQLIADGLADEVAKRTGLVIDAYFSGTKLAWLLDHVPDARARAEAGELAFGTIDSWLIWKLTEGREHLTDITNASRTMLFNIHTRQWDEFLLRLLQIPREVLPEVKPSSGELGVTRVFGNEICISGVAGDQHAALFGQACHSVGQAKNTYGTGCFVLMNTGEQPAKTTGRLINTIAWQLGDGAPVEYGQEGSIFIAGALIQWLRDGLGLIQTSAEVEALARQVPDSNGVYIVPAFVGLGAPHWDPNARGTIIGLTRGTNRYHIARAALEAIALQTWDVLNAMQSESKITLDRLRVDGGASQSDLLMQIQADLIGVPVERSRHPETTALGAAVLAGLGVGFWPSPDVLRSMNPVTRTFTPSSSAAWRNPLIEGWQRAVERARHWDRPER
ncbi:MAG: glycerol kinase GlpK [Pseudomonadota bacterium]|nr:glycerol kinase GlpK [Pseudomonadota bacterium]